jgi:hypothetical protein
MVGQLLAEMIIDGKPSIPLDMFSPDRFAKKDTPMPTRLM